MERLCFGDKWIRVRRVSRRRRLTLSVKPSGEATVTVGLSTPLKVIRGFILEHWDWLEKSQLRMEHLRVLHPEKSFTSLERFPFLGGQHPLQIIKGSPIGLDFSQEAILFRHPVAEVDWDEGTRSRLFRKFKATVLTTARQVLSERLTFWSQKMGLQAKGLRFRQQKSVWGSCSGQNIISLNLKLIVAPIWVIDYVVIHELAHIRHKNHSPDFWQLVESYTPHRHSARQWLKDNVYLGDFLGQKSDLHPWSDTE